MIHGPDSLLLGCIILPVLLQSPWSNSIMGKHSILKQTGKVKEFVVGGVGGFVFVFVLLLQPPDLM